MQVWWWRSYLYQGRFECQGYVIVYPRNIEAFCLEIIKPKPNRFYSLPFIVLQALTLILWTIQHFLAFIGWSYKELILSWDLNCDFSLSVLQSHSRRLVDILELFQMKLVVGDPTCITSNTGSLLDIGLYYLDFGWTIKRGISVFSFAYSLT